VWKNETRVLISFDLKLSGVAAFIDHPHADSGAEARLPEGRSAERQPKVESSQHNAEQADP
jgi:hypothetical protein